VALEFDASAFCPIAVVREPVAFAFWPTAVELEPLAVEV